MPATPVADTTVHHNDRRYRVTLRALGPYSTDRDGRFRPHNGKLFVSGQPKPDMPCPPPSLKGDDPDNDRAWRAYNRAEVKNMRTFLSAVVDGTWNFNRRAGCSCPCSPGFTTTDTRFRNQAFYVDVKPY